MKTYIIEIPVGQSKEEADGAWASDTINGGVFKSLSHLKERLNGLDIDKFYSFTVPDLVSQVNNGNDSFSNSYLASIEIDN